MRISDIYVYPIKSLRPCRVYRARLTRTGFEYDRKFMLVEVCNDGSLKNLHVSENNELCLFRTELVPEDENPTSIRVTFDDPNYTSGNDKEVIEIPICPEYEGLKKVDIDMHKSKCHAYDMGEEFGRWFTKHLKFPAMLIYLGDGARPVLGNVAPNKTHFSKEHPADEESQSLVSSLTGFVGRWVGGSASGKTTAEEDYRITFADVAPYLITTRESLKEIGKPKHAGQPIPNLDLDMTKLRPNIVLTCESEEGTDDDTTEKLPPFDEDYWGELEVETNKKQEDGTNERKNVQFSLTANCGRCKSLNVDYTSGKQLPLDQQMLKKLASMNRRIDPGMKWTPVFGRYGFLKDDNDIGSFLITGQHMSVSIRKESPDIFYWPGLST